MPRVDTPAQRGGRHDTCGVGPRRRCSLLRVQLLSLCSLTCRVYVFVGWGMFSFYFFIHLGGTFGVDLKHCSFPICPIPPLFIVLIPIHLVSFMCFHFTVFMGCQRRVPVFIRMYFEYECAVVIFDIQLIFFYVFKYCCLTLCNYLCVRYIFTQYPRVRFIS